ncbi:pyruvate kinase [Vibrio sp. SM6]|uniref:Pyruvate kinase n=1 Tax=Vibrio agarilyticus TaxID=2726741 RepID=A0A7X8TMJ2_9VIBR|nr:pyruvate kinase [Vibrio agarilyticus]NLS11493.1 pyruvate kinase [Vibrio agarilyticus]
MTPRLRRTKIVTTLGPATDKADVLERILRAGANVVRLNFSHGTAEQHLERAVNVRKIAAKIGQHVAILGDLQGPKIRISTFEKGAITLRVGEPFILDSAMARGAGNERGVGLDYTTLPEDVTEGDVLLLDDGRIQLKVVSVTGSQVNTCVMIGGALSDNKGINKLGGGLSAAALTEKDHNDIITAAQIGVDFLAISFPRNGADMMYARKLAQDAGLNARLVAKVERAETVATDDAMDEIIQASDAVMVARGDLGVEIGDPELVGVQKKLIRHARRLNRAVITATQMMESMISSPMPTRAEVMDVANAVLDGTDAVMLSGETAAGQYPVETVTAMAAVCLGAEKTAVTDRRHAPPAHPFSSKAETIAMSTMYAANHMPGIDAVISLTESGQTALLMSRLSSGLPIFALSRHEESLRHCALYRGVTPIYFDSQGDGGVATAQKALLTLKTQGLLESGNRVIITQGDIMDVIGSTNCMRILEVD